MKLGTLAFIRSNKKEKKEGKDFRIFTNEEMWHFILVEDGGFPKENNKNKYINLLKLKMMIKIIKIVILILLFLISLQKEKKMIKKMLKKIKKRMKKKKKKKKKKY